MAWSTAYEPLNKDDMKLIKIGNMPKTYEVELESNGEMKFIDKDGKESSWELVQFHSHTPSEHLFDGEERRLEFHFVHYSLVNGKTSTDRISVVSVSFVASPDGTPNPWLSIFMNENKMKVD